MTHKGSHLQRCTALEHRSLEPTLTLQLPGRSRCPHTVRSYVERPGKPYMDPTGLGKRSRPADSVLPSLQHSSSPTSVFYTSQGCPNGSCSPDLGSVPASIHDNQCPVATEPPKGASIGRLPLIWVPSQLPSTISNAPWLLNLPKVPQ